MLDYPVDLLECDKDLAKVCVDSSLATVQTCSGDDRLLIVENVSINKVSLGSVLPRG